MSLPAKSGDWHKPSTMLFSKEFHPIPDVETLVDQGLLEKADVTEELLNPIFPGLDNPDILASWYKFLTNLEVGSKLDQSRRNQLTQRVATRVALLYERARNMRANELPESESHLKGYDVESRGKGGTRKIEVKGRTNNLELTVTGPQWKALLQNLKTYYLYVVTDALSPDPVLHLIPAAKMQGIEFSLRVQPGTWQPAVESRVNVSSFHGTK